MYAIHIIINQNYFEYNQKTYFQKNGYIMGSSLSAILFELYIQNYELLNILYHDVYKQYIKTYFRYIGDIFVLFKGTIRQHKI